MFTSYIEILNYLIGNSFKCFGYPLFVPRDQLSTPHNPSLSHRSDIQGLNQQCVLVLWNPTKYIQQEERATLGGQGEIEVGFPPAESKFGSVYMIIFQRLQFFVQGLSLIMTAFPRFQ